MASLSTTLNSCRCYQTSLHRRERCTTAADAWRCCPWTTVAWAHRGGSTARSLRSRLYHPLLLVVAVSAAPCRCYPCLPSRPPTSTWIYDAPTLLRRPTSRSRARRWTCCGSRAWLSLRRRVWTRCSGERTLVAIGGVPRATVGSCRWPECTSQRQSRSLRRRSSRCDFGSGTLAARCCGRLAQRCGR